MDFNRTWSGIDLNNENKYYFESNMEDPFIISNEEQLFFIRKNKNGNVKYSMSINDIYLYFIEDDTIVYYYEDGVFFLGVGNNISNETLRSFISLLNFYIKKEEIEKNDGEFNITIANPPFKRRTKKIQAYKRYIRNLKKNLKIIME